MSHRSPTFVGHLIGASFGLVFVLVNVAGLPALLAVGLRIAAAAAFAVVLLGFLRTARVLREAGRARPVAFTPFYWLVVLIEALALVGGLAVLRQVEPAAALGWIALVVGLHFFPLSRLWPEGRRQLVAIATAMTVLGVIGLALAVMTQDAVLVAVIAGVGSGLVLLGWSLVQAVGTLTGRPSTADA